MNILIAYRVKVFIVLILLLVSGIYFINEIGIYKFRAVGLRHVTKDEQDIHKGAQSKEVIASLYSHTSLEEIHDERIKKFRESCNDIATFGRHESLKGNLTDFFYSRSNNFAYCKVPKCGSTFWMKLFMVMNKVENCCHLISQMSRADIHERSRKLIGNTARILHHNIRTVVVSRNPYSRLYSAFVDKVYLGLFWEMFQNIEGVKVVDPVILNYTEDLIHSEHTLLGSNLLHHNEQLVDKGLLIRKNSVHVTPICANNATFESFLKFIISETNAGRLLEQHWAPISHLCRPCRFNVYKIIKQETFSEDVQHVLKSLHINLTQHEFLMNSLTESRSLSCVPEIVAVVANKMQLKSTSLCISSSEMIKRLWKSFQIQGYISDEISVPDILLKDRYRFKKEDFILHVLNAISQKPMTSQESRRQRLVHLAHAFSEVNEQIIKDIQAIYYLDFVLFNYSFNIPNVKHLELTPLYVSGMLR